MKRKNVVAVGLIGILLAMVVLVPVPARTQGIRVLEDFSHAPIFGCVALLMLFTLGSQRRFSGVALWVQYLYAFLIAAALGALTELAQMPVGRDASWIDVRSDVLGAAGFLGLYAAVDTRLHRSAIRAIGAIIGALLLTAHSIPLATAAGEYIHREQAFPVLADFTQRLDTYFVMPHWAVLKLEPLPQQWARQVGERAMRVTFTDGPWPGVNFIEPQPDWRGYTALAIDVTNPASTELVLVLRVHDVHHDNRYEDRFNRTLHVPSATRTVLRIALADIQSGPKERSMDMQQIAGYMLFTVGLSAVHETYVGRVWLE